MIKPVLFLATCLFSVITVTAANAAEKKLEAKPVGQLTCQDFLMLDENFRPTAVAFAEGVTKKDKIVDPTLDVQGIAKVIPVVVQECTKAPKDNFISKVKANNKGKIK